MPPPRGVLTTVRGRVSLITVAAAVLAIGGFEAGRRTVDAAAVAASLARPDQQPSNVVSQRERLLERDHGRITVREIATVPFSQLYDVLKAASREQLLAWARDLEQMPRGPRQRAALTAYYKSLVQVDHRAAIEAVLQAQNLPMRDVAIEAMMKASPESIWADLAEMTAQMPYSERSWGQDNLIPNWSRVDPVAASRFVEKHRFRAGITLPGDEHDRVVSLLNNWGEIDPSAARNWLEGDASRQTAGAFRAFLTSWGRVDRTAAIDYAVANAGQPKFEDSVNELVYQFVRSAKEDATRLILLLPPERAKAALKNVADITNPEVIDPNLGRPPDYQRPPDEMTRWMATLPIELWSESIGVVAQAWLSLDAVSATNWFDELRPDLREVAVVSLCRARQAAPREDVLKLAWTISDPSLREKALAAVARSLRPDRDDAIGAIDDLSMSEKQKAYLRKIMPEDENGR